MTHVVYREYRMIRRPRKIDMRDCAIMKIAVEKPRSNMRSIARDTEIPYRPCRLRILDLAERGFLVLDANRHETYVYPTEQTKIQIALLETRASQINLPDIKVGRPKGGKV